MNDLSSFALVFSILAVIMALCLAVAVIESENDD